jgi:hypothetical protein
MVKWTGGGTMSTELYIQKNQSGEYHIFDDDNHQYWGPFFNLSDAQEMLAQIEPSCHVKEK